MKQERIRRWELSNGHTLVMQFLLNQDGWTVYTISPVFGVAPEYLIQDCNEETALQAVSDCLEEDVCDFLEA